jgi:hypothetical protein
MIRPCAPPGAARILPAGPELALSSLGASFLAETSRIWRQALGPLAEWIASTLWSTTSRASKTKAPATPLTQRRKREAKGIPISTAVANPLTSLRDCVPRVTRENTFVALKTVQLNGRDPVAQARRAGTQRRQAAALKAWNATQKPKWLEENFYREKIQPRLTLIAIPVLMSALGVSRPYATDIRAGRRPHPRHWLALAELVDLSADT